MRTTAQVHGCPLELLLMEYKTTTTAGNGISWPSAAMNSQQRMSLSDIRVRCGSLHISQFSVADIIAMRLFRHSPALDYSYMATVYIVG